MVKLILISLLLSFTLHSEELFDSYFDNQEVSDTIDSLKSKFLTKSILTKTDAGTPVHCLILSDGKESKPAILILGDTNSSSPVGSQILLMWLKKLLIDDQALQELLKKNSLYIIPRPFPDAVNTFFSKVKYESDLNSTPVDDDNDLSVNEDGFEDLNKDGFITTIRIKDEDGKFTEHKDSTFLMVKTDSSKGTHYKLISEGIDNDKDEQFNEDPPGGVNPNRNFSFEYPYFQKDAGINQMSEKESLAIAEFAFKHQEIFLVFSFGLEDNLLTPWKEDSQKKKNSIRSTIYKEDEKVFNVYSEKYKDAFKTKASRADKVNPSGSFAHWAYYHFGRISLTAKPWQIPVEEIEGEFEYSIKEIKWLQKHRPQALIKWEKIDHPDFPGKEVEIGGVKPFYKLIPDMDTCRQKAEMFQSFVNEIAKIKPFITVKEFSRTELGAGLSRIKLKIRNTGNLPLLSKTGRESHQMYPLNIELRLPDNCKIYNGHPRLQVANLEENQEKEISWLIISEKTEDNIEVNFSCPQIIDFSIKAGDIK